jgi:hypothetical protein
MQRIPSLSSSWYSNIGKSVTQELRFSFVDQLLAPTTSRRSAPRLSATVLFCLQ